MRYDKDKLKNKFARMPFLNKIRLIYSLIILIPIFRARTADFRSERNDRKKYAGFGK